MKFILVNNEFLVAILVTILLIFEVKEVEKFGRPYLCYSNVKPT